MNQLGDRPINLEVSEFATQYQLAERELRENISQRRQTIVNLFEQFDKAAINATKFTRGLEEANIHITSSARFLIASASADGVISVNSFLKALTTPDELESISVPTTPQYNGRIEDRGKKQRVLDLIGRLDLGDIDTFQFRKFFADLALPITDDIEHALQEAARSGVVHLRRMTGAVEKIFRTQPEEQNSPQQDPEPTPVTFLSPSTRARIADMHSNAILNTPDAIAARPFVSDDQFVPSPRTRPLHPAEKDAGRFW